MEGMEWFKREWPGVRALLAEEPTLTGTVSKLDEVHDGNPFVATQPWAEPLPGGGAPSDLEHRESPGQRPASRIERWRKMFPQARAQRVLAKKGMQQRVPHARAPNQAEIGQPQPPNISTPEEHETLLKEAQTSIREGTRRRHDWTIPFPRANRDTGIPNAGDFPGVDAKVTAGEFRVTHSTALALIARGVATPFPKVHP